MGSEAIPEDEGVPTGAPESFLDLYEDSRSVGDFDFTFGFGPKPIHFGGPLRPSEPLTEAGLRMWQDYVWSMTIAPTPISPVIITGI